MSKKSIHDKIKVDMVEGLITEKGEFIPEKGISVKNKEADGKACRLIFHTTYRKIAINL